MQSVEKSLLQPLNTQICDVLVVVAIVIVLAPYYTRKWENYSQT